MKIYRIQEKQSKVWSNAMAEPESMTNGYLSILEIEGDSILSLYPVDTSPYFVSSGQRLDDKGGVCQGSFAEYHPTTVAQYALSCWNRYLTSGEENHRRAFLEQAYRFVEHQVSIGDDDTGGWPISFSHPYVHTKSSWLSASAQGSSISVLTRAYQLTHEKQYLDTAQRAVQTFERDILDGGVSTPIGEKGIFFEDVAVYPAAHILSGFIIALFGLYDYVALTSDGHIQEIINRSLMTMHKILDEYDTGYWVYADLLSRRLASPSQLVLQTNLLEALARRSACEQCSTVASRWSSYQLRHGNRLQYSIISRLTDYREALLKRVREVFFPKPHNTFPKSVCVALPDFPFTGGITTFVEGVAQVTQGEWKLEYVTQHAGPNPQGLSIHRFGTSRMTGTQFPSVWFYVLAGWWKLITLMRNGANYHVILPQDGTFTAVYTALTAKLIGVRVVSIDHAELTVRRNTLYRTQRINDYAMRPLPVRLIGHIRLALYWPSLYILTRISARMVDHFLIPGVEGDEEEENCKVYGIPSSRVTRFASMINIERHFLLDKEERTRACERSGIPAESIVIAIISRLSPEKGLDIALESISKALTTLPVELASRVRVIIAGDGPSRQDLEESVHQHRMAQTCIFWGDVPSEKVLSLLAMSDIFLYTSLRGACYPMAVLEAMASGCAVIASELPISNTVLLAEGRGIAVSPGDIEQTSKALVQLLTDSELCCQMGTLARNYIAIQHNATNFRRNLMRVTGWAALDELLLVKENIKV